MPLNFKQELNTDTFESFAKRNVDIVYVKAQKATHDAAKAENLSAKALFGVLKTQHHLQKEKESISEEKALDIVLRGMLSAKEREQLDSKEDDGEFNVSLPDSEISDRIVKKAADRASVLSPTIAPTYTGTKSAVVLFLVVAFICLAISAIWIDPLGWLNDEERNASREAQVISAVVPVDGNLIDVRFEAAVNDAGAIPVRVYVDGPDVKNIVSVTYCDDNNSKEKQALRCGDEYFVMMVSSNGYYKLNIKGNSGLDVTRYYRIPEAQAGEPEILIKKAKVTKDKKSVDIVADIRSYSGKASIQADPEVIVEESENGECHMIVPFGRDFYINVRDEVGKTAIILVTENGEVLLRPSLTISEFEIGHDKTFEISLTDILPAGREYQCIVTKTGDNIDTSMLSGNTLAINPKKDYVGVDSITLSISDDKGLSSELVMPVVVVNTRPYADNDVKYYSEVSHTPSTVGRLFARVALNDNEHDELKYNVVKAQDCSVTMSENGNFILFVDPSYRGRTVSFTFNAYDGLLKSEEMTYTVDLKNTIIEDKTFTESFVCYQGADGWYNVDLPKTDADGDILNWTILDDLDGLGRTQRGNYLKFADGFTTLCVKSNPLKNEDFVDEIKLMCSDGWLNSEPITLVCKFKKNQGPKGDRNEAEVSASEKKATFMVKVTNDCPFDKCAIQKVISARGCSVIENEGWSDLKFTAEFEDGVQTAVVVLRVADILTGDYVDVRYTINRVS